MQFRQVSRLVLAILAIVAVIIPAAPATHASTARRVSAWLPYWDSRALDDFTAQRDLYDQVLPFWYEMRSATSIAAYPGAGSTAVLDAARGAGVAVLPTVTNDFDPDRIHTMLSTDATLDAHVATLTNLARQFDGLDIDYESAYGADRARFTVFTQRLASSLHAAGKQLSMTVHAKTSEPGSWDGPQSQDWNAIGSVSDRVRIMAYDYHWATSNAGGIAPLSWVDAVAAFAVTKMPASKVNLGVPLYGYDWVGTAGEGLTWDQIDARRIANSAVVQRSSDGSEPWFVYSASGQNHSVWYSDAISTSGKLNIVDKYHLAGVSFWRLGGEDPAVWNSVRAWAGGQPTPTPTSDTVAPTAVNGLVATGGVRRVSLGWNPATDASPIRYEVWRASTATGRLSRVATVTTTSYVNTGLRSRRTYWYAIRPVDAYNNIGPMSARAWAKTT